MEKGVNQPQFASIHNRLGLSTAQSGVDTPSVDETADEMYKKLAQRTLEIALIHEAGVRLTREMDLFKICQNLYEMVSRVMICHSFVVSSYDRAEKLIRAVYVMHDDEEIDGNEFPPLSFDADAPHQENQGTQGRAIRTGESLLLNDFEAYSQGLPGYVYEDGELTEYQVERTPPDIETTRAALIVPLKLDAQVTGVVQVMSCEFNSFNEDHLHFLEALAPQVAIALQNGRLHAQMIQANAELEARVEVRTAELKAALVHQQELNDFKAHLVSMVAHDFRTPLTVIQSSSTILETYAERLDASQRQKHFARIQNQISKLNHMIEDTLIISKADTVGLQPYFEATNVVDLVKTICASLQSDLSEREIVFHVSEVPIMLMTDKGLLQQAVTNLLTNALKYSGDTSSVWCDLMFTGSEITIRVRDQGIGIPQDDIERLFEPFSRASNVGSIKGTGLGLVIIKRIVEALQGSITLESSEGAGTTATLVFVAG